MVSKKRPPKKKSIARRAVLIAGLCLLGLAASAAAYVTWFKPPALPLSRKVLVVAVNYIKADKPPPTLAALQYAYVATVYNKTLQMAGQSAALQASQQMLDVIYPSRKSATAQAVAELRTAYKLAAVSAQQRPAVDQVMATYRKRWTSDGHSAIWSGSIPTGPAKWVKLTDKGPFTPLAGQWQRWAVSKAISVPPPAFGSYQDRREITIVKQAVASRTGEDINKINFWGGTPGTETPAGIWQNQLFNTIQTDLPSNQLVADKTYATIQQDVAQTISDAFMECWKVKYVYWTARPSMRIAGLVTAMANPPFPGYISGHSTISKAAADVLSVMVPAHAKEWEAMAVEARDSRLKAGIHFQIDNTVGFSVGSKVAQQVVANLKLAKQL